MTQVQTTIHSNEPGKVLSVLQDELEDFTTDAQSFLAGSYDEMAFQARRLRQGVYGQRQADVHMIRVKLPFGGVTPAQLDALGEVAETFVPLRKGHITTRQNIQYHHVPLSKATEVLKVLGSVGLSTREACGNTVRNVTGDPFAGVCQNELFDPTPYAGAFARYWLRNPLSQAMPRKFKVAFTATDADEAITGIHDIGFIPRIENGVRGFKMVVGGGLSIMPREAPVLNEFTPVDEYLKVSEAIIRIFDRADELRKNRAKARIKFLIDRVGIEEFRRMVDEELKGDWTNKDFSPDRLLFVDDEEATAPARRDSYTQPAREDRDAFTYFVQSNVKAQRQQGFSTVQVKVTRGDLTPKQFHGLADILRDYCGGRARTSIHQNLVLRWVRDESLYEVFSRLRDLGLADAGADSVTDVVSCPGTDSCKLGITRSMGLNRAIQERVVSMKITDERTRKIHIKMSGCPNSCGQHHIANIGFHGAVIKVEGHEMPAYHVFIGGNYDGGKLRLARQLKVRLPAKRGPETVERFLKLYQLDRQGNEEFNDFVDRVGPQPFQDAIADLVVPGEFDDENQSMFIDWGKSQLYKMERGEGECAI